MARLIQHLVGTAHPASTNQLLGLLAAGGQAPLHQHQIQALFASHGPVSQLAS